MAGAQQPRAPHAYVSAVAFAGGCGLKDRSSAAILAQGEEQKTASSSQPCLEHRCWRCCCYGSAWDGHRLRPSRPVAQAAPRGLASRLSPVTWAESLWSPVGTRFSLLAMWKLAGISRTWRYSSSAAYLVFLSCQLNFWKLVSYGVHEPVARTRVIPPAGSESFPYCWHVPTGLCRR